VHFPEGGRNSSLSSKGSPHVASLSGHGDAQGISTSVSHRDQGGGGETDFRDKSDAVDGSSSKKHAA